MVFQHALCGCGILLELGGGAAGPRHKLTAAVWAGVIETLLCAFNAARAFERANARVSGIGGKIAIAALAVGS
jgi:hypothetical protein